MMQFSASLVRLLIIGFAAIPVAFGALRAMTTGNDYRYLVTALVALLVATLVFRVGASWSISRWRLAGLALAGSTLAAAAAGVAQGASSAPAVAVVALGFGLCVTASGALGAILRDSVRVGTYQ